MMHYSKGKNVEEELTQDTIPMECLPKDFLWMHVKGGTHVTNVIDYVKKSLDREEYRSVVWTGSGGGVGKTISCAEILKRHFAFHQVTRLCYRKVEEYWDPQMEGLEQIVATRQIPCVHILLSLDEIDPNTPGYQHSGVKTTMWLENTMPQSSGFKDHKRAGPSSQSRNRTQLRPSNRNKKPSKQKQNDETPE